MRKTSIFLVAILFLSSLPIGIEATAPVLNYYPSTINFGSHTQGWTGSNSFEVWGNGTGILYYNITESLPWITIYPDAGTSSGEHDSINVSVYNTDSMNGYYSGYIYINSSGGSGQIFVDITINPPASVLSYTPSAINFGTQNQGWTGNSTFEIWNSGGGTLYYNVSESISWISLSSTSGSSTGEHDTITVNVINTGSMSGYYSGTISISSNGGSGGVFVNITINSPELSYSPYYFSFGPHLQGWTGSDEFEIWNNDTGILYYNISESLSWITIYPTSGSSTGEHDTINVSVSNTGSMEGYYYGYIYITSSAGNGSVYVSITIYEEETTYYFNGYNASETWAHNPSYMTDGNENTYAYTAIDKDSQYCNNNTYYDGGLGTIESVYLRVKGYRILNPIPPNSREEWITLMPYFDGSFGDIHSFSVPEGSGNSTWSDWIEITYDTNSPDPWTWSDVQTLDCRVKTMIGRSTLYCGQVEIKVEVS